MKILGIDPGLAVTGWGIVAQGRDGLHYVASGVIKTKAGVAQGARLMQLWGGLEQGGIVRQVGWAPAVQNIAAIENVFVGAGRQTAIKTAEAVGVIKLWLAHRDFDLTEYAPASIKKEVAGHGRADKFAMRAAVRRELGYRVAGLGEHETDALAAAILLLKERRNEE